MRDEFLAVTGKQFDNMRNRFKPKYSLTDPTKLLRPGREIPFSKPDYRAWVYEREQSARGLRCSYCDRKLALDKMEPDHIVPVKNRGGSLALSNIAPACRDCNIAKGDLTGDEWRAFLKGLATFPEAAKKYIMKKLRQRPTFRPHPGSEQNKGERVRIAPVSKLREPARLTKSPASRSLFTSMESPEEF